MSGILTIHENCVIKLEQNKNNNETEESYITLNDIYSSISKFKTEFVIHFTIFSQTLTIFFAEICKANLNVLFYQNVKQAVLRNSLSSQKCNEGVTQILKKLQQIRPTVWSLQKCDLRYKLS